MRRPTSAGGGSAAAAAAAAAPVQHSAVLTQHGSLRFSPVTSEEAQMEARKESPRRGQIGAGDKNARLPTRDKYLAKDCIRGSGHIFHKCTSTSCALGLDLSLKFHQPRVVRSGASALVKKK